MATETTSGGFPSWAIALLSSIVGVIVGFILNLWRDKKQEGGKRRQEALEVHFKDVNSRVIYPISEMARSVTIRNERLVTSRAPISESYDFEKTEEFEAFELHFPEEANEWKKLNNQAIEVNGKLFNFFELHKDENAHLKATEDTQPLQRDFSNFAKRLADKVESIEKYQIGTGYFKYEKNCPICKKF